MLMVRIRNSSGLTLVETMVSIGIMSFMFATLAYIIFMSGRNSYIVRDQSMSQSKAAAASERVTNVLRNSKFIRGYATDDISKPLSRLLFEVPDITEASGVRIGAIAFVPPTNANSSDGIIKIFEDSDDYSPSSIKTTKADWEYENIQKFVVSFHSQSWVTVSIGYSYRGFSLDITDSDNDGVFDSRLAGEFMTDAIAKNHHPGESANYAATTATLIQL